MTAFYNEIDPKAAAWLRDLIARGLIADGVVDERDIRDIAPADLLGFTQCHFFAGIGVWSYALRRAGWNDDRPVWTGSCPCQPFSAAGKGAGFADERHLWPSWFWLIEQCRPAVVFGEQVASKDAEPWIDLVQDDLEALGYAVGAVPFPSAGIGAPHIRDRLYWVADAGSSGLWRGREHRGDTGASSQIRSEAREQWLRSDGGADGAVHLLGDAAGGGQREFGNAPLAGEGRHSDGPSGLSSGLANADGRHPGAERQQRGGEQRQQPQDGGTGGLELASSVGWERREEAAPGYDTDRAAPQRPEGQYGRGVTGAPGVHQNGTGPTNGLWRDADWLLCRDGKWRPVEPGTFPLAHGAPARVGRLRGYGNAINAEAARTFIEAYLGDDR